MKTTQTIRDWKKMKKLKALVTIGVPASGKTTFAKKWEDEDPDNRWVVELDEIRKEYSPDKDLNRYSFKNEEKVADEFYKSISFAWSCDKDICISNTNVNGKYLDVLLSFLDDLDFEVTFKVFHKSFRDLVRDDKKRNKMVGSEVIYKMLLNFNKLRQTHPHVFEQDNHWLEKDFPIIKKVENKYPVSENKPCVAIIDIDGTLADMGKRNPYDYEAAINDTARKDVALLVNALHKEHTVVFVSGRSEDARVVTEEWLHGLYRDRVLDFDPVEESHILMRCSGDTRQDWIVKYEIYRDIVSQMGELKVVVDDRPQVIRMWEMLGVDTIFNVGSIHKEF